MPIDRVRIPADIQTHTDTHAFRWNTGAQCNFTQFQRLWTKRMYREDRRPMRKNGSWINTHLVCIFASLSVCGKKHTHIRWHTQRRCRPPTNSRDIYLYTSLSLARHTTDAYCLYNGRSTVARICRYHFGHRLLFCQNTLSVCIAQYCMRHP